ncbi:cone-rod homeobox protein-like [Zingiber officinale]|uniref:cone-rod homeobox protein-like n=1 Tax=Zingiber officinale TaxID=94328 RepID=UPI001C4A9628|nr:cone-rod homeobox protein-like [Zingiber officinale]
MEHLQTANRYEAIYMCSCAETWCRTPTQEGVGISGTDSSWYCERVDLSDSYSPSLEAPTSTIPVGPTPTVFTVPPAVPPATYPTPPPAVPVTSYPVPPLTVPPAALTYIDPAVSLAVSAPAYAALEVMYASVCPRTGGTSSSKIVGFDNSSYIEALDRTLIIEAAQQRANADKKKKQTDQTSGQTQHPQATRQQQSGRSQLGQGTSGTSGRPQESGRTSSGRFLSSQQNHK